METIQCFYIHIYSTFIFICKCLINVQALCEIYLNAVLVGPKLLDDKGSDVITEETVTLRNFSPVRL